MFRLPRARSGIAWTMSAAALLAACGDDGEGPQTVEAPMTISVSSSAFADGETIPVRFTCDGADVCPPLELAGVPAEAAELALLVEDPDAPGGTFAHWAVWALDPGLPALGEDEVPADAVQGQNDFGTQGYRGPCPPAGDPHRYVFTLFAAEEPLGLSAGATAGEVRAALEGNTLAAGTLTGLYGR